MKIKYILVAVAFIGFSACGNDDDAASGSDSDAPVVLPELITGEADFSTFVSVGASFTAGFIDNGLFKASQENSFPNTLAKQFAKAGGGNFTQPLMNDNFGGLILGGNPVINPATNQRLFAERLVFGGSGPVPLQSVNPLAMSTTDFALNNPTGPFNNVGVPGAKSFHMVAPGYGNLANFPAAANPYAIRLTGTTPNASMLELAIEQNPTFFTLSEIGGNDVLGYATSGGDGTNPITDLATFNDSLKALLDGLTSNGAKGAIGNLPNITSLSFFTTVPFDALDPRDNEDLEAQIDVLNSQLYGILKSVFTNNGEPDRVDILSKTTTNPVLINDEEATDLSAEIATALTPILGAPTAGAFGAVFGKARQATTNDLLVLTSASAIGATVNGAPAPINVNGISFPLEDKWVLTPKEQGEIAAATSSYNNNIEEAAKSKGIALVDLNSILQQASTTGIIFDEFDLNTSLVTGGLVSLDGIHLTARGYALMANAFLEAIDKTYGSNFKASGNVAKAADFPVSFSPALQ